MTFDSDTLFSRRAALFGGFVATTTFVSLAEAASAQADDSDLSEDDPADQPRFGARVPAGEVKAWCPYFMKGPETTTKSEAMRLAGDYDIIVAQYPTFTPYLSDMRAANGDVKILGYVNATFTWHTDLSDSWYCKDSQGRRITATGWAQTYLMNPADADYEAWVSALIANVLETTGYDGMFVDVLGVAPLDPNYVSSMPVDPETGEEYLQSDWLALTSQMVHRLDAERAKDPILGNGLMYGPQYFSATAPTELIMAAGISGGMSEAFSRPGNGLLTTRRTEASWIQDITMIQAAQSAKQSLFAVTKTWVSGSTADKRDRHIFSLATFLLGNDGSSYFHFSYVEGDACGPSSDLNTVDLGGALGAYDSDDGVYQRSFEGGKVFVNLRTVEVSVTPGGRFRAQDGDTGATFTLGAYCALILYKA